MSSSSPSSGHATPTTSSRRASEDGQRQQAGKKRDEPTMDERDSAVSDDEELRLAEAHVGAGAGDAEFEETVGMLSVRAGDGSSK